VRAEALADELILHKENEKRLEKRVEGLSADIEQLKADIEAEKQHHFEEVQRLKREHEDAMHELIVKHEEKVREIIVKHEQTVREIKENHASALRELNEKHNAETEALTVAAREAAERHTAELESVRADADKRISDAMAERDSSVQTAKAETAQCQAALMQKCSDYNALTEEKRLAEARIKALGGLSRDYTDRDSFNELEREYNAFTRVYKEQWAKTKKQIRKSHLNIENIKGQKEQDKSSD
jgi:kinesin family protein 4/21/27